MSGFEERWWRSGDGLSLFARDYAGAGGAAKLPVVCLHGLTRNSRDFEDVAPRISAAGRRVLVPDVRGRGRSDRDPRPERYTPRTYARDVIELLDQLGIARAVFVGTSMGGIITMALAALRPRAVGAVVLNDVGPVIAPEGIARIKSYVGNAAPIASWDDAAAYARRTNGAAFPDFADADWETFARRLFREEGGIPTLDYDPGIAVQLAKDKYKAPSFIAWRMFRNVARGRPGLLVRGELSDLLSRDIATRMKAAAPWMEVVEVPRVGHAPMLTEPVAAKGVDDFLARVP